MPDRATHIVTGAFGFSGRYIAKHLLDAGVSVRTLTNSLMRENMFGTKIRAYPYNFDNPDKLVDSMRGASVLYNTYWVRFNYPGFSFSTANENSAKLFEAAHNAGIKRIVHISILNASENSPLEYYRGKALVERRLKESGISHSILRPAVLFGKEDILINNIAYLLRRFPMFNIFDDGSYKLQPIFVDDLARLAIEEGSKAEDRCIDAIGPETFTFKALVQTIGKIIGKERKIISVSPEVGYIAVNFLGKTLGDIIITKDEVKGLMMNLLYADSTPAAATRLTDYLRDNANTIGMRYASELARRKNRFRSYENL